MMRDQDSVIKLEKANKKTEMGNPDSCQYIQTGYTLKKKVHVMISIFLIY